MNVNPKYEQFQADESPQEGDFIGPPDIRGKIDEILKINEGDSDEQFLELCRLKFPECGKGFTKQQSGGFKKVFGNGNYIRLMEKNRTLHVSLIQMPNRGIECFLEILSFAIDNSFIKVTGSAQPQKRPTESKRKRLIEFHNSFGMTNLDGYNSFLELSNENKRVLVNKIKYYLENGRWFKS